MTSIPPPMVTMTAMLVRHCSDFRNRPPSMKRRSRRNLFYRHRDARCLCAMRQRRNPASSRPSARPMSPPCATAAHCCSPTAANCGSPASKSPMTAAPHCKHWSPAHSLRLERLGAERDRYGRIVAFALPAMAKHSMQQAMLEEGHARVSAHVGDKACADGLLSAESAARAAGRGLWADPNFAPLSAENLGRTTG